MRQGGHVDDDVVIGGGGGGGGVVDANVDGADAAAAADGVVREAVVAEDWGGRWRGRWGDGGVQVLEFGEEGRGVDGGDLDG